MTKEEVNFVCKLLDIKQEVNKQVAISKDIGHIAASENNMTQVSFQNGKMAAYNLVNVMIDNLISKIKSQTAPTYHACYIPHYDKWRLYDPQYEYNTVAYFDSKDDLPKNVIIDGD